MADGEDGKGGVIWLREVDHIIKDWEVSLINRCFNRMLIIFLCSLVFVYNLDYFKDRVLVCSVLVLILLISGVLVADTKNTVIQRIRKR